MRTYSDNASGPLLVGLDIGTTNIKAVVYRPDGRTVALASVPAVTHVPRPAWAYYEPDQLWALAVKVLRDVTAQIDDPARIAGIAVASMGEAGVPLDKDGKPTYQCIAWFDRRTIPQCDWLGQAIGEDPIFAVTGLSLQPIFGLCKLMWIKENEPEAFARTTRWLHVADYIAFELSGEGATDWSLASRSMAFDLRKRDWDDGILRTAGIPRGIMAPAVASGTGVGSVTREAALATGLPVGAVVSAGGQDHVCGALAARVVRPGQILDSMGTAEALFVALDEPLSDPEMGRRGYTQGAHVAGGGYYVFGGLYTSGASVDWARDIFGAGVDYGAILAAARAVPPGSLGAGFIPHLRLANAPHADSRARAAFVGLTTDVTQGAMMRAVLEGLAYEARSSVEPLLGYAGLGSMPEISVIGGGAKNDLLLRIKASVMDTRLNVLDLDEATALGAAILGGIGAGVYRDVDDALATVSVHPRAIDPDPEAVPVYETYFREVYRLLYDALAPLNHRIHALMIGNRPSDAVAGR